MAANRVARGEGGKLRSLVPILSWSKTYRKEWFSADLIAGLTVGAFAIPECLAYAQLAGLPIQVGLYAEISALAIYFLLGSSRQLSVGTTSALSILVGTSLGAMALGDPSIYWAYASLTAILVAAFALVAYILRMGFIVRLISNPVLTGFTAGAAFYIASSQLPKLLGIPGGTGNFFDRIWNVLIHLGEIQPITALFGLASLGLLFLLRKGSHRIPGAIILVVASLLLMAYTPLGQAGLQVEGSFPSGFPVPALPDTGPLDTDTLVTLSTLALACVLLAYVEGMGVARSYARRNRYRVDGDQELIALAGINLASGITKGFTVGGSVSRSAVNNQSGAKTQLASGFAAIVVIIFTLFLGSLIANIPQTVLAAIVIFAVSGLVDIPEFKRILAIGKRHFAVAGVVFGAVLLFGLLEGMVVGVVFSAISLLERIYHPRTTTLGLNRDKYRFQATDRDPEAENLPGVIVFHVDSPLVFVNTENVRDEVERQVYSSNNEARLFIMDMKHMPWLDTTALDMIRETWEELAVLGIEMRLANAPEQVIDSLDRAGLSVHFPNPSATVLTTYNSWKRSQGESALIKPKK